jgi:hypothetical protein
MISSDILIIGGPLLVIFGVALGWWARPRARWCERCGHTLECRACRPVATSGPTSVR